MKRLFLICAITLMAGCSGDSDRAKAIKMFTDACKVPVSGRMTFGYWDNSLTFECAQFKPEIEVKK